MLWTMRLVIFVFALVFGAGCWYVFAQTPSAQTTNTNQRGNINGVVMNGNMNASQARAEVADREQVERQMSAGAGWTPVPTNANSLPGDQTEETHEEEAPSLEWAEPNPAYGHAVASRVTLRSESNASSNIIATLDVVENESVEITDATRDFLRVKFPANTEMEGGTRQQEYEGWVEWGAVVPYTHALVVETGSGEVVGRVALDYGVSNAAFSPDGARAVFYGAADGAGHGDPQRLAYELDTESYKILRTLKTSTSGGFASILYDDEGDLRPLLQTHHSHGDGLRKTLHPFRVKGELFERSGDPVRPGTDGLLLFSRDGASGFDIHGAGDPAGAISVDVIDLKSFAVRNSFPVEGTSSELWSYEYAVSPDGAEFFYREGEGSIRVVDARTGQRVREIKPRMKEDFRGYLAHDSVVGDSLFIRYWQETESEEGGELRAVWLKADGKTAPAEKGIDNVVEAAGTRYAVNDAGTRLFRLDADGRIAERIKIARPDSEHRPKGSEDHTEDHTVMGLYASPDGKHIVIFFGIPDGC